MDSTFEHLIKLHMESKEFSDVILEGNRFIIAHQDGRTRFKAWGNDKKQVFTTFRSIVEMADIVCGVLDFMLIRYTIKYYTETPRKRQIPHFIIQEVKE